MSLPTNILVPIDFSKGASRALDLAIDLGAKLGAKVTALHVYELPAVGIPDGVFSPPPDLAAQIYASTQKGLEAAVEERKSEAKKRGIELGSMMKTGEARATILAAAKEIGADLVVMGTHGRRGLVHVLLGSVAEYVVRTSPIPVLTVRSDP